MTLIEEKCAGSGQYPIERTALLDTSPGIDPVGTCQICRQVLTLDFYRMPDHPYKDPYKEGQ